MSASRAAASLAALRASTACCPGFGAGPAPAGLANIGIRAAAAAPITTRKRRSAPTTRGGGGHPGCRGAKAVSPATPPHADRSGSGGGGQAARDLLEGCDPLLEGRGGLGQAVE